MAGAVGRVLAASPGGDQPGTRIEDHAALVAVVRREHLAQALDGTSRLAVAQAREGHARVLKPPDERERGVEVVSVEDRLVDVLEAHPVEAGALEDVRGGFGIAERERVRARLRWLRRVAQRGVDRPRPFVVLVSLPDKQHQARLGSKGSGDVGERGGRVGEKHRPEAADRHVEAGGIEAMHLGVAQLVPDVVEPFRRRQLTGALEHALGHVDADNAARSRGARRLPSRQPGSAPDVEHLVTRADPVGGAKVLVVSAQLVVVEVQEHDAETLGNAVSQENVELVRRLYAELASEGSTEEFEQRMSDDALGRFLDPEIEWAPVTESLLAVDSYRGFDGVRRFWGEFLSAWERYRVETLRFDDAGDQVAVVVHIVGRTHELEVDETRSSLLTVRDGRVVRVQSFADPDGARQAAGLPP